jgi:aspartyl-tRNA(Asn)/glutamyl-tRNA(Gln) amidotransferase subunit A
MNIPMPRLKGAALRSLLQLVDHRPFSALQRQQMSADFRLEELLALPAEARGQFDEIPDPRVGRTDHGWASADYDPPTTTDHREGGFRLREAYEDGSLSPVEVLDAIVERIEADGFGELVHSPFVTVDLEGARRAAEASRERWADGEPKGPMDGIPVVIKDHHDMEGLPTGSGTAFMGRVDGTAETDSEAVRRLRGAGAILLGKTRTTEWGFQPTGFNANQVMPRNPYDRGRGAGGSSTGTGAAVALGLAPVGLGSDGGGSIRIPSSVNGIFGLKPTFQRLSRVGDHWKGTMSHCGPLGQSTRDLVDFLSVAGGAPDPNDPATCRAPADEEPADDWRRALGRGVDGCRIGIWSWAFEAADDELTRPCWTALRALEREGAELVELEIDYADFHQGVGAIMLGVESNGMLREYFEHYSDQTGDDVDLMTGAFESITAREYMYARRTRATLRDNVADAFREVDLLAAPTTNAVGPSYPLADDRTAIYDHKATHALTRFSFLANLCGLPAGSMPVGLVDGLPVGLQLMGDAWDEASVLAAMAHAERLGLCGLPRPSRFLQHRKDGGNPRG